MSNQTFVYNREQFVELCVNKMHEIAPGATVTQKEDDFHWEVELGDKKKIVIYLGNVWSNYQRTNDLGVIAGFFDTQITLNARIKDLAENGVNPELVFPTFRQKDFNTSMGDEKNKATLHDTFSDDLSIFYVQDHPQFVSFIVEEQIPDGYTPDSLADKAFDNLKKQGWVEPVHTQKVHDEITLHVFQNPDKQYQAQFMVRDMYEAHLGDYFFVSFPTRDHAIVLQYHNSPDDLVGDMEAMGAVVTMKKMSVSMFQNEASPLSHVIHRVTTGDVKVII